MPLPELNVDAYTYADYLTWPEDRQWELINGRVFAMSPAPSTEHQRIFRRLFVQIATHLEGKPCEVFSAPFDVRLPRSDEADDDISTVVQPDIAVICEPGRLDEKGCRGAPDWIIEIVSPASASHDMIRKLNLYEMHGVSEYWVIQPFYRLVIVYLLNDKGAYDPPVNYDAGQRIPSRALPDLDIDLNRVFDEKAD